MYDGPQVSTRTTSTSSQFGGQTSRCSRARASTSEDKNPSVVVLTASCGPSYISGKLVTPRLALSCQLGVSTASARAAYLRSSAERSSEHHARARARRARQSVWWCARGLHGAKCMCSRGPRFHSNAASICMSRYMTAMANLILPGLAPAEIGPRPCYRSPPKTRMESLGTFRSHLE